MFIFVCLELLRLVCSDSLVQIRFDEVSENVCIVASLWPNGKHSWVHRVRLLRFACSYSFAHNSFSNQICLFIVVSSDSF